MQRKILPTIDDGANMVQSLLGLAVCSRKHSHIEVCDQCPARWTKQDSARGVDHYMADGAYTNEWLECNAGMYVLDE
jgi:hypothetical protein